MSLVAISGNASGTGTLTIAAPNTNSNRTLTLPDGTGTFNISGVVNEVPAGTVSAPSIYPTGDTNTGIFFPAADTIAFAEGGAEAMRINSSGNLLVGTQSAISGNAQITIVGPSTNRGALQMGRTTAATTGVAGSLVAYNGSNAICGIDWQSNGANNSGYIGTYTYNAGAFAQGPYLNTGGTNWTAASDERLKNVTGEIENALYKVSQIRAVEFTWKADTLNKQNIGFIAQDVQLVLPEVIDTDTNGNLGVRYAEVTSLLLAAIKEQQALIIQLQADVAELKGATP